MFSFRKKEPDAWKLELGFSDAGGGPVERHEVTWTAADSEASVLSALHDKLSSPELVHEHVCAQLVVAEAARSPLLGVVSAAGWGAAAAGPARLALSVRSTRAALTEVELTRVSGTATLGTSLVLAVWGALEVGRVTHLRVSDAGAVAALADARVLSRFTSLRTLNLSNAGLAALPDCIGLLTDLQELRLTGNQLRVLPMAVGKLTSLRVLAADSNQLTILPGELRHCVLLEELTLQHNRLDKVLFSFTSLRNLRVLHLYDNPLEFLPEIAPCSSLQHLTVANLSVTSDPGHRQFSVDMLPPPPGGPSSSLSSISLWDSKQADKLRPIFSLMLRRSSGHHPLLAGALRVLAEDPKNRELMARQENGLQQLVLMALSDNPVVVEETCRTLGLLAEHSPALAEAVVANDADALMRLLPSIDERRQLSTLSLLAAIAYSSPDAAACVATEPLLASLQQLVGIGQQGSGAAASAEEPSTGAPPARQEAARRPGEEVRTAALKALGNLAFCEENRRRISRNTALMSRLSALALCQDEPLKVQVAALRVLAVLGENDLVWRASGRPPIKGRGLRILSLDGGGMKGMATVRLLRELERHTGRRIHELFDLIVGTSTGGLLAVALGLRKMSLDECEHIYKVLGRRVFSRIVKEGKEESWVELMYRTFRDKTSHVRAVVVGYKHDAAVYESLLREYCDFGPEERCIGDAMIDTAGLDTPAVALVSTLASVTPAPPFVFRNYQLPPGSQPLATQIGAHAGSCKHPVWQAVRASSAASFYLEDFSCGGDKFQDGAVTANNPSLIALQEARLLWPDHQVDVMVSLGVGLAPPTRRDKGLSSFIETGAILIESSTDVQRVEEALATLLPLVPGVKYFRFHACDPRCAMELDEVDPQRWAALEAATDDYIAQPATQAQFADVTAALVQAESAAPGQRITGPLLGGPKRLLVLRCPRLGGQHQAGVDDAVAASLSLLPQCATAVNLQSVAAANGTAQQEDGPELLPARGQVAIPAALAAAGGDAEPAVGGHEQPPAGDQQQEEAEAEGGGLSAYLTSWFGSPSKPVKSLSPPVLVGLAAAAAGSGSSTPRAQGMLGQPGGAATSRLASGVHPAAVAAALLPAAAAASNSRRLGAPRAPSSKAVSPAESTAGEAAAQGSSGMAGLLTRLEDRLAALLPSVGIVHLGLPHTAGGAVMHWRQRLQVVAEPSVEASALLSAAGLDPATSRLVDVFSRQPSLQLSGARTVSALSTQTQWAEGGPLSSLLLSAASPSLVLRASSVPELGWLVRSKLVTSAATLPAAFVDALLAAGARGVICRAASSSDDDAGAPSMPSEIQDCCTFFAALYDALLSGTRAGLALKAAEHSVPQLDSGFVLHTKSM